MKTKLRTEIITEITREITVCLHRQTTQNLFDKNCQECSAKLMTINEGVQISGIAWNEIVRLIKIHKVHFAETANGEVFICSQSILDLKKNKEKK